MKQIGIAVVGIAIVAALTGCATVAPPSFKDSRIAYDKPFESVWNAALQSVADQTIDRADKAAFEISTKPVDGTEYNPVSNVTVTKVTTIKFSPSRPYSVRVRVLSTRKKSMTLVGTNQTNNTTETFSDTEAESKILGAIDSQLSK